MTVELQHSLRRRTTTITTLPRTDTFISSREHSPVLSQRSSQSRSGSRSNSISKAQTTPNSPVIYSSSSSATKKSYSGRRRQLHHNITQHLYPSYKNKENLATTAITFAKKLKDDIKENKPLSTEFSGYLDKLYHRDINSIQKLIEQVELLSKNLNKGQILQDVLSGLNEILKQNKQLFMHNPNPDVDLEIMFMTIQSIATYPDKQSGDILQETLANLRILHETYELKYSSYDLVNSMLEHASHVDNSNKNSNMLESFNNLASEYIALDDNLSINNININSNKNLLASDVNKKIQASKTINKVVDLLQLHINNNFNIAKDYLVDYHTLYEFLNSNINKDTNEGKGKEKERINLELLEDCKLISSILQNSDALDIQKDQKFYKDKIADLKGIIEAKNSSNQPQQLEQSKDSQLNTDKKTSKVKRHFFKNIFKDMQFIPLSLSNKLRNYKNITCSSNYSSNNSSRSDINAAGSSRERIDNKQNSEIKRRIDFLRT